MSAGQAEGRIDGAGPAEYNIVTLVDFLKVPKERRRACLDEFFDFLEIADAVVSTHELLKRMGAPAELLVNPVKGFVWVDDGKRTRTLRIELTPTDAVTSEAASSGKEAA